MLSLRGPKAALILALLLLVGGCAQQTVTAPECGTPQERIVRGNSLAPLIVPGQSVTVLEGYYECHDVEREDIIAYNYSGRTMPIIKMVRGIPGDRLELGENPDGTYAIFINGEVIGTSQGTRYELYEQDIRILLQQARESPQIPQGQYLILGEDVHGSLDSTFFGLVNSTDILGRVNVTLPQLKQVKQREAQRYAAAPPNILIITIDTLRADHMGIYGYSKNTTPFLDQLFAQGVVYENAITPAYLTFQSDASMLTGVYPSQHNIMDWNSQISQEYTLLPEVLGYYNYTTAAFVSPSLYETFLMNDSFDKYVMSPDMKNINQTKKEVSEYLRRQQRPFFVFWHTYDVHIPFYTPAAEFYNGTYDGVFRDELSRRFIEYQINWPNQTAWGVQMSYNGPSPPAGLKDSHYTFTPEDEEYLKAAYDYSIRYTDEQLEIFFTSIQDEPWYDNTIIIITSEHGEDLEEHSYIFHRDLYDVNTRVPLAIIYPKGLTPRRVNEPVNTLDIMPSVLGLLNITVPANAEGHDILAPAIPDRKIYTERQPFDEYSVRTAKYKYILRNPDKKTKKMRLSGFMLSLMTGEGDTSRDELYDLEADPGEQQNLIGRGVPAEAELRADAIAFRERMRKARAANAHIGKSDMLMFTYP